MRISSRSTLAPAVTGGSLAIGGTAVPAAATGTVLVARRRGA
ncbi:hypothetical protein [Streptomyces sp. APSN-46.1]|nr:hypothetical protein [Streptomyces sp. APSN-46.1]